MTSQILSDPIARALVLPYLNHAVRMYEQSYASRADIDAAMRFGCGYPIGPLGMLDEIGLSGARDALAERFAESDDHLHRPADLLETMVSEGRTFADEESAGAERGPQLRHDITSVGVVGTGTMASGIVEVFAKSGFDVVFVGRSAKKLEGVRTAIARSLDKAISRGRLDEATKAQVLDRLTGSTSRADLAGVDLVVEAIAEDLAVKTELFADLDRICKNGAILATTTSSLPIASCAAATRRPESVIGLHFFNPAPVMKLVEVVTTELTAAEVDETSRALCVKLGKVAVSCGDRAGFIVNALLFPYLNDAVRLLESGAATIDEIDDAIKAQVGFPMGPFALLDVVGNDVSLTIQQELFAEFGEKGFAPAVTLETLVAEGKLGRKSGEGFRTY